MIFKDSHEEAYETENEDFVAAGKMIPFPAQKSTTILALTPQQATLAKEGLIKTMTVYGNSLEDIGIFDGDKVICKKAFHRKEIGPHTICIVYVPSIGDSVAKKVRILGKETLLKSCNRDVPDMYVDTETLDIRGIVIGLQRSPDSLGRFDRGYDEDIPL